jgi:hypothetical protein
VVIFVLLHIYSSLILFGLFFLLDPLENGPILAALVPFDLLSLLSLVYHHLDAWIVLVLDLLEHPVRSQVLHVPLV